MQPNDAIKEFDGLKSTIDEFKIQRKSDEREINTLEETFEALKKEIKDTYGVEITDFESAINTLKGQLQKDVEELKKKIENCKTKLGVTQ